MEHSQATAESLTGPLLRRVLELLVEQPAPGFGHEPKDADGFLTPQRDGQFPKRIELLARVVRE
jgi:hypothetical protein